MPLSFGLCSVYLQDSFIPSDPTICSFQSDFSVTQQWPYMKLHHLELHLHYTWTGVDIKRHFLQYFQSPHKGNMFDPTYCSHWRLHCQSSRGGKKMFPCWKQVKWKKQPVIIHLMAFIVIILIAFIWILFQMLAGTETSPPPKNPRCVVLLWVMFLLWLNVWQLLLSISFQRPVWVHWY